MATTDVPRRTPVGMPAIAWLLLNQKLGWLATYRMISSTTAAAAPATPIAASGGSSGTSRGITPHGHLVEVSAHLQFTHQSSVGDDLLTGSDFDTLQVAGELAGSYDNVILRVALSTTSRDEEIRSPYGAAPTPLNIMIKDFGRAGEDAWLVGLSYNFEYFGLEGLSGFVNYGQGYGARGLPNEEEFDITLDYQFKSGALHHWWLRVRNAFVNEMNGGNSINNFRIILNYDLPII
jgi:hypothetical protein